VLLDEVRPASEGRPRALELLRAMFDVGYFPPNTPPPIE
jgi:hypothetical protein